MSETFDPLGDIEAHFVASAVKQRVRNIIRSYNHPADLLAEPTQNAVDEIDEAVRAGSVERGHISVAIDCSNGKVSVQDNGRGISTANIRRLLAPDMTGKAELFRSGRSRGHKGVGLTFLAYGFNFFEIESRTADEHYRVRIENARQWIEDSFILDAPPAAISVLSDNEGHLRETGTIVTVQVSDQTEPRNLFRSFPSADFARNTNGHRGLPEEPSSNLICVRCTSRLPTPGRDTKGRRTDYRVQIPSPQSQARTQGDRHWGVPGEQPRDRTSCTPSQEARGCFQVL